ncbi:hypothetical protein VYU27_010084, partial [Nannochloropsis oceanica]
MKTAFALSLLFAGANAFQAPFFSRAASNSRSLRTNDFTTVQSFEPSALPTVPRGLTITMDGKSNAIRGRIVSVKSTKKITEAMRLVAAAKVRRAQEAVLSTRPFNEGLQSVFSGLVKRLALENIELPLLQDRAVKSVTVVCMTGDRGLCGGYNAKMIKQTERRLAELKSQGLRVNLITIGMKGQT